MIQLKKNRKPRWGGGETGSQNLLAAGGGRKKLLYFSIEGANIPPDRGPLLLGRWGGGRFKKETELSRVIQRSGKSLIRRRKEMVRPGGGERTDLDEGNPPPGTSRRGA